MRRSRISEIFIREGLRWRHDETANGSIRTSPKNGVIEQLYTAPPAGSIVVCLDEMGRPGAFQASNS
jgi:hypothetical protein